MHTVECFFLVSAPIRALEQEFCVSCSFLVCTSFLIGRLDFLIKQLQHAAGIPDVKASIVGDRA